MNASNIEIRNLSPNDSIAELTALLHRAYARLGNMGLNYTAVDQDAAVTERRINNGTCYVAVASTGRMCGTITLQVPLTGEPSSATDVHLRQIKDGAAWLKQPGIAHLGQFAVDPDFQGRGLGERLMHTVEVQASSVGAKEIALDTAEPAVHLVAFYTRRGYRFVGYAQWPGKTYRSVIMSKPL